MEWRSKRPPPFIARNILGVLLERIYFQPYGFIGLNFGYLVFMSNCACCLKSTRIPPHGKSKKGQNTSYFSCSKLNVCVVYFTGHVNAGQSKFRLFFLWKIPTLGKLQIRVNGSSTSTTTKFKPN